MDAVCKIENYGEATKLLSATTLRLESYSGNGSNKTIFSPRNVLGTKTLSETLSDRDNIAKDLKALIDSATDPWGIDVSLVLSLLCVSSSCLAYRSRELRSRT